MPTIKVNAAFAAPAAIIAAELTKVGLCVEIYVVPNFTEGLAIQAYNAPLWILGQGVVSGLDAKEALTVAVAEEILRNGVSPTLKTVSEYYQAGEAAERRRASEEAARQAAADVGD